MRKNILFLTDFYYPDPYANGICVNNIIEEMQREGFDCSVICYGEKTQYIKKNSLHIYQIKMRYYHRLIKYGENNINTILGKIAIIIAKLIYITKSLIFFYIYPFLSPLFMYRYKKNINKIIQYNKYAAIIATYNPFEALYSACLIKKKYRNIKFIIYSLDSLSNGGYNKVIPKRLKDYIGFKWEKKFYKSADLILNMKYNEKHYNKPAYHKYKNKMMIVDIPLYSKKNVTDKRSKRKDSKPKTHLVYLGALNKTFRNPKYLCNIIGHLGTTLNIELHFFSRGNCEGMISMYSKEYPDTIFRHGYVNHNTALEALSKADILVSVGNKNIDLVPSKIFEYISSGKKIMHFYQDEQDSSLQYLKLYPNAVLINETSNFEINKINIMSFIQNSDLYDTNQISKMFLLNTPNYTVNIIKRLLNN